MCLGDGPANELDVATVHAIERAQRDDAAAQLRGVPAQFGANLGGGQGAARPGGTSRKSTSRTPPLTTPRLL
jgi:hypothetical protein